MRVGKWTSSAIAALVLFSSYGTAFGAEAPTVGKAGSDIQGHWAESQVSDWMSRGLVTGYKDGSFKPNGQITRAEFFALINRSFGFTEKEVVKFGDLPAGSWAYDEVSKAVKAGYVTGYANGNIGASDPISRQEAAVIVARLLDLQSDKAGTEFSDAASFASWANPAIRAVSASGIMRGSSGKFSPGALITRSEAVVTLDRAGLAFAASQANRKYDTAGTYGPETGKETISGSVAVNVPDVTLKNMVIEGDLILGEGIGSGDAFLEGVEVKGRVLVHGGGENSIHFNDSVLVDVIIDKASGMGTVRIVSEGSTTVALVIVNSPAVIQESGSTAAGFGNVNVSSSLPAGSKVTLQGSFDTLNVSAKQIQVDLPAGSVKNLNAASNASDLSLNLNVGVTVNSLVLDAIVKVLGRGTIIAAVMNTGGSTFQTPPQTISGVGAPSAAPPVTTTPSTPALPTTPSVPLTPAPTTPSVPSVNKAALTSSITAASELLEAHRVGEAHGNVAQAARTTYEEAIFAANKVFNDSMATQSQINTAVTALNSASNVFGESIIVVDTTALSAAITTAGQLLLNHPVGEMNGNVSQETHDALNQAIADANMALTSPELTNGGVQSALTDLATAVSEFQGEGSIIVVDTTALNAAVEAAEELLLDHPAGEANGSVPAEEHSAFSKVVQSASAIVNNPQVTKKMVQEMLDQLATAQSAFQGQYVVVTLTGLQEQLASARQLLTAYSIGEENGNVSQSSADLLTAAISTANSVLEAASSTQVQVNQAMAALSNASTDFSGSVIVKITIQTDSSLSSTLPMLRITEMPAGTKQIKVYDGTRLVGSAQANGPAASVTLDYLAPGTHTLTAQMTSANSATVIGSNVVIHESSVTILPQNQITAGSLHGAVLSVTGAVHTWGFNHSGQIGDGTTTLHPEIYDVPGMPTGIIAIEAGYGHTMILTQDGKVWKWGQGAEQTPAPVDDLDHIVAIGSEGGTLEVALKSDGTVLYKDSHSTRVEMGLTDVKAIVGTYSSAYALKKDGTVWAWGSNTNGQLGNGTTSGSSSVPTQVLGLPINVTEIRGGNQHGVALTEAGDVYVWGFNNLGQLGDGTLTNSLTAIKVQGLSKITAIGVGNYHVFAKTEEGKMYAWGGNYFGQLGLGNTERNYTTPQLINYDLSDVTAISGGGSNTTFALLADGRVMSWGSSGLGMLGNGEDGGSHRTSPGEFIPDMNLLN